MKKLAGLVLILASNLSAQTFQVSDRGHDFTLTQSQGLTLRLSGGTWTIKNTPCSSEIFQDLKDRFRSTLTVQLTDLKDFSDTIRIKEDAKVYFIPANLENGQRLKQFPDTFIKSYLIHNKLCPAE